MIGIGLDASPLKKGLESARASVASTVAGIKDSAAKLSNTKLAPDVYGLKPDGGQSGTPVMDVVDRFNARRAAEIAGKAAAAEQKAQQKSADAAAAEAAKVAAAEQKAHAGRVAHWGAKIPKATESTNVIPPGVMGALEALMQEEKTLKKVTESSTATFLNSSADYLIRVRETVAGKVGSAGKSVSGSGLATFAKGSGFTSLPGMLFGGAKSAIGGGTSLAGSGISRIANLPATLSQMAMPLNQTLELAGKAQRLLGAPIRAMQAWESSNSEAVWKGGRSALNDSGWSGTLQRFEVGVETMFANILNAVDKVFNLKGWVEAARGAADGVTRVIEGLFGSLDQANSGGNNLEEMFMAGQDVAIDFSQQIVEGLADIYNASLDVAENVISVYNAIKHPTSESAFYKGLHQDLETAGLRDRQGNKIGRVDKDAISGFFGGIRNNLAEDRWWNEFTGKMNREVDVDEKAQSEANKALGEFTRGLSGGGDAIKQAQEAYAAGLKQIDDLKNAGGGMAIAAARQANEMARARAVQSALQPIMDMQAQSREAKSYAPNSSDLIESIARLQYGGGQGDYQSRIAAAAEQFVEQQKDADRKLADIATLLRNAPPPAFAVGGIGG